MYLQTRRIANAIVSFSRLLQLPLIPQRLQPTSSPDLQNEAYELGQLIGEDSFPWRHHPDEHIDWDVRHRAHDLVYRHFDNTCRDNGTGITRLRRKRCGKRGRYRLETFRR